MPAFRSEGLTDDMARDLTLLDLKALGLGTMSQALQFKSHVVEFLSGASIEKPHAAAASGVSGAAGAAVPSAPPVDDDCNDVLAPPTLAPACAASAPPVVHPSLALSLSDIPTEFTDQFNPKPAAPAPPPPPQPHSPPRTQVLHHGAAAGPSCRRRWIHVHPPPPCPPLLLSPLQSRLPSPPSPFQIRTQQHAAMAGPRPQHQSQKRGVVAQHSAGAKS